MIRRPVRAHSIQVEMDAESRATAMEGGALLERVLRHLGIFKELRRHLPTLSNQTAYGYAESAYALVVGMLLGGRGLSAAELLRHDAERARLFGLSGSVPEEATMYRRLLETMPRKIMRESCMISFVRY